MRQTYSVGSPGGVSPGEQIGEWIAMNIPAFLQRHVLQTREMLKRIHDCQLLHFGGIVNDSMDSVQSVVSLQVTCEGQHIAMVDQIVVVWVECNDPICLCLRIIQKSCHGLTDPRCQINDGSNVKIYAYLSKNMLG